MTTCSECGGTGESRNWAAIREWDAANPCPDYPADFGRGDWSEVDAHGRAQRAVYEAHPATACSACEGCGHDRDRWEFDDFDAEDLMAAVMACNENRNVDEALTFATVHLAMTRVIDAAINAARSDYERIYQEASGIASDAWGRSPEGQAAQASWRTFPTKLEEVAA